MGLNLSCVGIPSDSKAFNKPFRNSNPFFVREGNHVRIKIADCAIEFARGHNLLQLCDLAVKAVSKVCNLLAHCRWCGSLAMGAGHHGHTRQFDCHLSERALKIVKLRKHHILH